MNNILISSATLVSPEHPLDGQVVDILIEKGIIRKVSAKIAVDDKKIQVIDAQGAFVSPGFFDLNVNFGEPGLETKEDIYTGTAAAAAGGFTGVAVQPNTRPAIHGRSEVALIINSAKGYPVDVYPIGAISKKREGQELAELYDMKTAGAIAFSDGNHSVQQAGLMARALLYSKGFGGLVIAFAEDTSIAGGNQMNEGVMSTYLGMKGNPNLAESLMVARDLFLAEYNDASIHFTTISTAESVALIREAKAKGLKVTCDVAAHHLVLTDEEITSFDSQYKVTPPLRTSEDVKALLEGVKDGTVDAVVSQHTPHEVEYKNVEFHIAQPGIIGLQTVLPFLVQAGVDVQTIVDKLAIQPRKIVNLEIPSLLEGTGANLSIFSLDEQWRFDAGTNRSKATNSPLFDQQLKGKIIAVINNNQIVIN